MSAIIGFKIFLAYEADGAAPLFGEVFKSGSCRDVVLRVTHGRIVHPVTDEAFILLHGADGI